MKIQVIGEPKIILSSSSNLKENGAFLSTANETVDKGEKPKVQRLFVRVPTLSDNRINVIYRLSMLNRGDTQVVLFDESTRKYSSLKNTTINPSDAVIGKLGLLFGDSNVILK